MKNETEVKSGTGKEAEEAGMVAKNETKLEEKEEALPEEKAGLKNDTANKTEDEGVLVIPPKGGAVLIDQNQTGLG